MHEDFLADGYVSLRLTSQQGRDAALLRASTDLFAQEAPREPDEIRRYEELALHLIPKVALPDRAFVAEKLAPHADAPLAVIRLLAKDDIAVAAFVLQKSAILGPLDLLVVISATSVEHHRLIARRPGLSTEVMRALRIAGDSVVATTLDHALVTPPRRASDEASAPPRPDDADGRQVQPGLPPNRRAADALRSGRFDPWAFLELDRPARVRIMADLATRPPIRHYAGPANRLDRAFRSILSAAQIVGLARTRDRVKLVAAIADGVQLPADFIGACLDDPTGEPLAVLLKALALDNTQAQQVFLLAADKVGRDATVFFKLCDIYAGMEGVAAETLTESWREAMAPTTARHRPVFEDTGDHRDAPTPDRRRDQSAADVDKRSGGSAA